MTTFDRKNYGSRNVLAQQAWDELLRRFPALFANTMTAPTTGPLATDSAYTTRRALNRTSADATTLAALMRGEKPARCINCRHWRPSTHRPSEVGECPRVGDKVWDDGGWYTHLNTYADFGCVLFEPKAE